MKIYIIKQKIDSMDFSFPIKIYSAHASLSSLLKTLDEIAQFHGISADFSKVSNFSGYGEIKGIIHIPWDDIKELEYRYTIEILEAD